MLFHLQCEGDFNWGIGLLIMQFFCFVTVDLLDVYHMLVPALYVIFGATTTILPPISLESYLKIQIYQHFFTMQI